MSKHEAALIEVAKAELWGQVPSGTTLTLKAEIARLRAALAQAHERMDVAWNVMHPGDLTLDEREVIAQALWFGMEELDALDPSEP